MERAALTPGETPPVQKDARPVHAAGHLTAPGRRLGPGSRRSGTSPGPGAELPVLVTELGHRLRHPLEILVIGEMSAMGATSLPEIGGGVIEHPLTAPSEDAGPRTRQEGEIDDPGATILGIVETEPFMGVGRRVRHHL